jgi:phytoene/squalene synthetase
MATRLFEKETRRAIYGIYGFVRFADEIVDTFHDFDKKYLLNKFESDYYDAFNQGISLNPILNSFQLTVKSTKSLMNIFRLL